MYAQDTAGDENWRLYLLDLDSGEPELLTPGEKRAGPAPGAQPLAPGRAAGRAQRGQPAAARRLPGATWPPVSWSRRWPTPGFAAWLIDTDLAVRGGVRDAAGRRAEHPAARRAGHGHRRGVGAVPGGPGRRRAGHRGGRLLPGRPARCCWTSSIGANASRLLRVDLDDRRADGDRRATSSTTSPGSGCTRRRWSRRRSCSPRTARRSCCSTTRSPVDLERLRALGDGELGVSRSERSDTRWLVSLAPSDGPVAYYTYDRADGRSDLPVPPPAGADASTSSRRWSRSRSPPGTGSRCTAT